MKARSSLHVALVAGLLSGAAWAAEVPQVLAPQAAEFIGRYARVCGVIASARYARSTRGSPTYLNFDKPYPHNEFTAIVWGRDRKDFPAKPEALLHHKACVTGEVESYKGKPQIILRAPDQIIFWPLEPPAEQP